MKMSLGFLFVIYIMLGSDAFVEAAPRRHLPPATEPPVRHVKLPIKFISLLGKTSEIDGADMAFTWPANPAAAPADGATTAPSRRPGDHTCIPPPHHNLALGSSFAATGVKVNVALKDSASAVGLDTVENWNEVLRS